MSQIDYFDDEDCRRERRGKYLKSITSHREGQSSKGRHKRNKPPRRHKEFSNGYA